MVWIWDANLKCSYCLNDFQVELHCNQRKKSCGWKKKWRNIVFQASFKMVKYDSFELWGLLALYYVFL